MSELSLKDSVQSFFPVKPGIKSRLKVRIRSFIAMFLAWAIGFAMGAALMYCKLAVHVLNKLGMFGN